MSIVLALVGTTVTQALTLTDFRIGMYGVPSVRSDYDVSAGEIRWYGEADAWFLLSEMTQFASFSMLPGFENAYVDATLSGISDMSYDGIALATFSSGIFEMGVYANYMSSRELVVKLTGHLEYDYEERERFDNGHLEGYAHVIVDTKYFLQSYWNSVFQEELHWGVTSPLDMIGEELRGDTILPVGVDITDYSSDYNSAYFIATLTTVPEPATLLLLSLGGLILRKKRA